MLLCKAETTKIITRRKKIVIFIIDDTRYHYDPFSIRNILQHTDT